MELQTMTRTKTKTRVLIGIILIGGAIAAAFISMRTIDKLKIVGRADIKAVAKFPPPPLASKPLSIKEILNTRLSVISVNETVKKLNNQYLKSKTNPARAEIVNQLKQELEKRKTMMASLIVSDPKRALEVALSDTSRSDLPKDLQGLVEKYTSLEGRLTIFHQDFFDEGRSIDMLSVTKNTGEKIVVYPASMPRTIVSGDEIRAATGIVLPDTGFATENLEVVSSVMGAEIDVHKVAGILVKFTNTSGSAEFPNALGIVQNMLFGEAASSFANYIKAASYDKTSIVGTTLWAELPNSWEYYSNLPYDEYSQAIVDAVDSQINWSDYDHIITYVNPYNKCGGGSGTTWKVNFTSQDGPFTASFAEITGLYDYCLSLLFSAHELLHGFGLNHAGGLISPNLVPANLDDPKADSQTPQYSDNSDMMAQITRDISAFRKEQLGWLKPNNTIMVTSSGNYILEPIETAGSGVKQLKIPLGGNKFYSVEYRQPSGFDALFTPPAAINGALLRFIPENLVCTNAGCMNSLQPQNLIINNDPWTSFYDAYRHISVTMISRSAESAQLHINLEAFVPPAAPPVLADYLVESAGILPNNTVAGNSISFFGTVKNLGSNAGLTTTRLTININNNISEDDIILETLTNPLATGGTELENFANAWIAVSGTHSFKICANATGVYPDSNPANNCSMITFVVSEAQSSTSATSTSATATP